MSSKCGTIRFPGKPASRIDPDMPHEEARAWWNTLTPEQRNAEALNILGFSDPYLHWDAEWDHLTSYTQIAKLHLYFHGTFHREDGTLLTPIHNPGKEMSATGRDRIHGVASYPLQGFPRVFS